MTSSINNILIVGGGTAGWLSAAIIAAAHQHRIRSGNLTITVCESPNIPTVGVGEGTWPTMRATLESIGVSETAFMRECHAAFKQGSKFVGWGQGHRDYQHPFESTEGGAQGYTGDLWMQMPKAPAPYAKFFGTQAHLVDANRAPKTLDTPEFYQVANYGYHLDAGAFTTFLQKHSQNRLGIKHILADMTHAKIDDTGHIESIETAQCGSIKADLFIDCTGFKSLLIKHALGGKFQSLSNRFFANKALAVQMPYAHRDEEVAPCTISTAQTAGWIWDIGLPTRRGIGHVYSDQYISDETAQEQLLAYIGSKPDVNPRMISFTPGRMEKFWIKNCVAVGLSAGFIEPLEASALLLIELSAKAIANRLPKTQSSLPAHAKHFNQLFDYRWNKIIDFLKLHYVLSDRDTPFWQAMRAPETVSEELSDLLSTWQHSAPTMHDFVHGQEVFQSQSYQYVLYGAGFKTSNSTTLSPAIAGLMQQKIQQSQRETQQRLNALPSHRALLNAIQQRNFPAGAK